MAKVIIFCHNRVELKVFVWKYIKFLIYGFGDMYVK